MGGGTDPGGDDREGAPPEARVVAARALIQGAVACRGSIEFEFEHDADGAVDFNDRLVRWLGDLGLFAAIEPLEAALLETPVGSIPRSKAIESTWACEGMAILAWSLGRVDLPSHDQLVDKFAVADALGFLGDDARSLLERPALRPLDELAAYREFCYDVHVRLRGRLKGRKPLARPIETRSIERLPLEKLRIVVREDLAIDGRPIEECVDRRVAEVERVTHHRHRASIWLVGEHPLYTETPVDT
ncbi:DUF4272 domain-containing protein [Paludisphaera mucosa]|uniref:DUF4272 domain-containing protein n=1 Tax=Paludisphaera mucosa TaxID=3030827 RepID=A0ABT6FI99_9BACT|nr:DUF4272 domain-containing protein [Paludisphaera mucosa]MDG3007264.1 DUF4272 domain-containing protein [Paludisphaera mucosa]